MKKIIFFLRLILVTLTSISINSCNDMDDNLIIVNIEDLISKNSELYNLLDRTTNPVGNPIQDIICLDFIYPLTVRIYNSQYIKTGQTTLTDDNQFSTFLGHLQRLVFTY